MSSKSAWSWVVLSAIVAIAIQSWLATEHLSHVSRYLPYAYILLYPLIQLFLHHGMASRAKAEKAKEQDLSALDSAAHPDHSHH